MLLKTLSRIWTQTDEFIIHPWLFNKRKQVTIRLPLSSKNKKYSAYSINKLVSFTRQKVKVQSILKYSKSSVVVSIKR